MIILAIHMLIFGRDHHVPTTNNNYGRKALLPTKAVTYAECIRSLR